MTDSVRGPASPCIGVCRLDTCGEICVGCRRTLAEIASWPRASREERNRILTAVAERRQAPAPEDSGC